MNSSFSTRQALRAYATDKPEQIQHQAKIICMQLLLLEGSDSPGLRATVAENIERLGSGETARAEPECHHPTGD